MNESSPESKKPVLSVEEMGLVNSVEVRMNSIELYMAIVEMKQEELIKMNNYLEESYRTFLPKVDTENLHSTYEEFADMIKRGDEMLASSVSRKMEGSVSGRYILTKKELEDWKANIEILKNQTIPRLKEEGLKDQVDLLEDAIMASEIKIAYDYDVAK
ncbi:MAG: hypothetical protein WCQ00_03865 [bacterium]